MCVFTAKQFAFQILSRECCVLKSGEKAVQMCNCCIANLISRLSWTGAESERDWQRENKVLTEKVLCSHTNTDTLLRVETR